MTSISSLNEGDSNKDYAPHLLIIFFTKLIIIFYCFSNSCVVNSTSFSKISTIRKANQRAARSFLAALFVYKLFTSNWTLRTHHKSCFFPRTVSNRIIGLYPPDVISAFERGTHHGACCSIADAHRLIPLILDQTTRPLHVQTVPCRHGHSVPLIRWCMACYRSNWGKICGDRGQGGDRGAEVGRLGVIAPWAIAC